MSDLTSAQRREIKRIILRLLKDLLGDLDAGKYGDLYDKINTAWIKTALEKSCYSPDTRKSKLKGSKMPEYVLPGSDDETFQACDDFTRGYVEALFFTENAPNAETLEDFRAQEASGENEGSVPRNFGAADLAPEAWAKIKEDCAAFQKHALPLSAAYDAKQAGRDFWFSRNGHGSGFWDRGLGDIGDSLHKLCGWRTPFPEINPYVGDDGKVYL